MHGGETTIGAIDDKLRHSISQLSTWHFTAAEKYKKRIIDMGHEKDKVFMIGPLALDGLARMKEFSKKNLK